MSNSEDLLAVREILLAMPYEQIKEPNIPINVYVQEAENLAHWCIDDLALLTTAGIDNTKIDALKVRAGACREAQSLWVKDRRSVKEAEELWMEKSPLAYDLRDELIHTFRFAFRNEEKLLGRVAEIYDGDGHADMLQDLNDLSVLGKENVALLSIIGFDVAKLEAAAIQADELAELYAIANGIRQSSNEVKELRDRAYSYLKELVDEVSACGKYLFWKTPKRIKGYYSDYWRKRNTVKTAPEEIVVDSSITE